MDTADVIGIGRELLYLAILLSAPVIGVSLVVGLLISVMQTLTSIQEQTISFAPRIVAAVLTIAITLPWILGVLIDFTRSMIDRMGQITL